MIAQLVAWANGREDVRAMVLTSSRATPLGSVDIFSDYDLILIVTDIHPFAEHREWLEDFGRVLTLYRDPIMTEDGFEVSGNVTQFESGLRVDFTLWPVGYFQKLVAAPELTPEFDAGYRVLLDKDNLTIGLKPPTYKAYIPTPPTEEKYLDVIEVFFLGAIVIGKLLWREDLLAAKHLIDRELYQEHLLPMLEWHIELEHGWTVKPGGYGRRLKKWLRPDLYAELESTFAGAGIEANWASVYKTMALMRRVAVEVGEKLGYAYPHELEARVLAFMDKVKNLERGATTFP